MANRQTDHTTFLPRTPGLTGYHSHNSSSTQKDTHKAALSCMCISSEGLLSMAVTFSIDGRSPSVGS